MQYVVMAWDGTDNGAPERRLAARPTHLERIQPRVERGGAYVLLRAATNVLLRDIKAKSTRELEVDDHRIPGIVRVELSECLADDFFVLTDARK